MTSRVALVTGGTGGIGTAICKKLADMGHKVATNYRNEEKARAWQAQMKADGLVHGESAFPVSLTLLVALALLAIGLFAIASTVFSIGPFG